MMHLSVDLQIALENDSAVVMPEVEQIEQWASFAVRHAEAVSQSGIGKSDELQMSVRIVDEDEITQLNSDYRQKNKATNVLSFPFVQPPGIPEDEVSGMLGDLVICAAVVNREAEDQYKTKTAHWAHMIVHGTLHLLGYDHQVDREAEAMETLETEILSELGFGNPYE